MTEINTLRDKKTGRFLTTTNSTKYKRVQFNGKIMSEHQRVFCIELDIPEIPKGFVVHHIDENKKNNDISNLSLMDYTAHNRIHSHEPWNKGVKTSDNTVNKQRVSREKGFLLRLKETYKLYNTGKTQKEVGILLGITRGAVSHRIKKYKENLLNKQ